MASNVLKRTAFAFPVFSIERLDKVKPTLADSSLSDIFRFAIITSRFTTIAIAYTVMPTFVLIIEHKGTRGDFMVSYQFFPKNNKYLLSFNNSILVFGM